VRCGEVGAEHGTSTKGSSLALLLASTRLLSDFQYWFLETVSVELTISIFGNGWGRVQGPCQPPARFVGCLMWADGGRRVENRERVEGGGVVAVF
jgi:hypothetical protein